MTSTAVVYYIIDENKTIRQIKENKTTSAAYPSKKLIQQLINRYRFSAPQILRLYQPFPLYERIGPSHIDIGKVRVLKIANEYKKQGYLVIANPDNHAGADLIIISLPDGHIRKVIEVTNWKRPNEFFKKDRLDTTVDHLTYFADIEGVELELVVSYIENLNHEQQQELKRCNVKVSLVGAQDQPEEKEVKGWED